MRLCLEEKELIMIKIYGLIITVILIELKVEKSIKKHVYFSWALGGFIVNDAYGLIGVIISLVIMFICVNLLYLLVSVSV